MALGFLGLPYRSIILPYDDEKTPMQLIGKKMLPIMMIDGTPMAESLDIVRRIDTDDRLSTSAALADATAWSELEAIVRRLSENVHALAMPHWVWTAEFTPAARNYFIAKKSLKRGPFAKLVARRTEFESALMSDLRTLSVHLRPFWDGDRFTIKDVAIAAQLWGMYVVPEFRFSQEWHDYLMAIKNLCHFEYQAGFWESE